MKKKKNRKNTSDDTGNDLSKPGGIELPEVHPVYRDDWGPHSMNRFSALKVHEHADRKDEYAYYVNMDNEYLQSQLKHKKFKQELYKDQFRTALTFLGLSLLHKIDNDMKNKEFEDDFIKDDYRFEYVSYFSESFAPLVVPIIGLLGQLDLTEEDEEDEEDEE